MDMSSLRGKTALVTGAASGIGLETALAFARRGADLVICDLDETRLGAAGERIEGLGRSVLARRVDVSSADEMRAFAAEVHQGIDAVDILMNNAGVAIGGPFLSTSLEDWNWILGINTLGVVHGCHFFIPNMVRRAQGGHVINVSSAAGYSASSMLPAYNATKFSVLGLSEALWEELRPHAIGVTAVCPGLIDTPITRNARLVGEMDKPEMREDMVRGYQRRGYTPDRVARNILKAVEKNRLVAPISPEAWALYYVKRFAPWLLRRIGLLLAKRAQG
ncbi:MAG: SDR family NAD(P)-dependent oxidoreductase [Deltaproteobacteria bacterium]|nr:SDR family NAD(P)-dependent oxidoreductase [Deltaproteobacteria bacterium]MBW2384537.1 SDR family NAD(P)-dependent oxidoreductase [Deltaproteobacteria bacterium]MBW2697185.1 SDR family NAD(P)-dependent oxidoreductase [Deltaproteobacteria bacterium]